MPTFRIPNTLYSDDKHVFAQGQKIQQTQLTDACVPMLTLVYLQKHSKSILVCAVSYQSEHRKWDP